MTFQSLCQKCGTNISYGVIAKSLETAGNIKIRGMDRIVYQIRREFVPKQSTTKELLGVIATSVGHYLRTVEHNVTRDAAKIAPRMERQILSADIPKATLDHVREVMTKMLTRQKSEALAGIEALEDESLPEEEKGTAGVGYFYFET